ncbi:MAG TPA: hypothetical protein VFF04_00205 [Candidatus Babeliales bacterium]|nr:hypothetical protein [Candidatus Babeliales bacterium]
MHKSLLLTLIFTNICTAGNLIPSTERRLSQAWFAVLPVVVDQAFFVVRNPPTTKTVLNSVNYKTATKIKKQTPFDKRMHAGRQNYGYGKKRH